MSNKSPSWYSLYKLGFVRVMAFCILSFEHFWPRIYPSLLTLLLLAGLVWAGFFQYLSFWPHVILLWLFLFVACAFAFLLFGFRFPTKKHVDAYIENKSKLYNQPLTSLNDVPVNSDNDFAKVLWQEHKRRMATNLQNLRVAWPNPAFYQHDPYGLRSIILLFAIIAFVFSFGPYGGRLRDLIDFRAPARLDTMRIDAWVTPPEYSGMAPIYLSSNRLDEVEILAGSTLNLRVVDAGDATLSIIDDKNQQSQKIAPIVDNDASQSNNIAFESIIDHSGQILLHARNYQKQWHFTILDDRPPTIQFTKAPARILTGSLELNYQLEDDYGVSKAYSEITLLGYDDMVSQPLYSAPEVPLLIPRGGKGEARTVQDISSHPWAGAEVRIRLVAEDGKGQKAYSQSQIITLPQRIFANPISRALVEQRRILAGNALMRDQVLYMLDALMVRPQDSYNNMAQFISFRSARTGLSLATDENSLRASADYLWQIANDIEGDLVNQAEKRLKQAQAALRDALRNGASPDEIERLMEALRQATQEYIAALTEQSNGDDYRKDPEKYPFLSDNALQKKLQELEDLAKTGNRGAAEQLLSELENLMDNLQVQKGQPGQAGGAQGQAGNQRSQMQNEIDKLADLMRRQQEALNDTYSSQDQFLRGEQSAEQYQDKLNELQKKQQELQDDLSNLQQDLQKQGLTPPQQLQDAQDQMAESGKNMEQGSGANAAQSQNDALNSMRQAAQGLMQQMQEALKKNQDEQGNTPNAEQNAQGKDPLGRNLDGNQQQSSENSAIPEESELQKAKRILEELRKKLGRSATPELEKQYLERLLQFN